MKNALDTIRCNTRIEEEKRRDERRASWMFALL